MNKSESIKELAAALIEFQKSISSVKKDSSNPFFKCKYASLSNIISTIQEPLSKCGLAITQMPTGENQVTTLLLHKSGEYIESTYTMKPTKDDPQGVGSCITYQRRYALGAILNLNIDEDDDGNAASTPQKASAPKKPTKPTLSPDHKHWQPVIDKLANDEIKIADVENKYKLSKENREELISSALQVNV